MTSTGSSSKPWAYNCARVGVSRTELLRSYSRLLSCATPAYIPTLLRCTLPCYSGVHCHATLVYIAMLLRCTLPCYSGVHCHATPVYIAMLLRSILLCYSGPPLDWTGLHLTCLLTRLTPDLTWEVVVIHLSLMYLFLVICTY